MARITITTSNSTSVKAERGAGGIPALALRVFMGAGEIPALALRAFICMLCIVVLTKDR
jgi:hypothetical protein